ncbi:hypothetical protein SAMN05421510_100516 [Nitrosomonas ureae]|uniref:Uncharacterized protein n=1 Tax=Nitrosomonas ureae TaxID=44577 RepID=A0A1H9AUQ0_9PROT|nr:hypothetical protein C8R28_100637 [Nitrosomonas ureae]PXX14751.1 hypothetical protein C8R27_11334 [Nitrosomonas ureae]SDT83822.1 hypothetical protein SAMN05216406_1019 [Nitrosomonas ureae]SEP80221.1 hypothetical protein SAMN05421510_100516 [Nitrosomonas ureae]
MVSGINQETVLQFVKRHLAPDQYVQSDTLPSLAEIGTTQNLLPIRLVNSYHEYTTSLLVTLKCSCSLPFTAYRQGIGVS